MTTIGSNTISLKKVKQEIEQNLQPIGHYKTAILCATIIKRLDRFDAKQLPSIP